MSTDTKTSLLVINRLTEAQFNNVVNPSETELWLTPDDTDEKLAKKQDKLIAGRDIEIIKQKLPSSYVELEYIQGTANVQYINTGIVPNSLMSLYSKMQNVSISNPDSTNIFFGARDTTTGGQGIDTGYQTSAIFFDWFGMSTSDRYAFSTGPRVDGSIVEHTVKNSNVEIKLNGTSLGTHQFTPTATITQPLYINGLNNGGTPLANTAGINRVYHFTIDGVCDLIPAKRTSDNVLGMYDLIRDLFLTNAGTGTFTAGPEVPVVPSSYTELQYIEATGTQYINTGVVGDLNTEYEITVKSNVAPSAGGTASYAIFGSRTSATENNIMSTYTLSTSGLGIINDFGDYNTTRQLPTISATNILHRYTITNGKSERTITDLDTGWTDTVTTTYSGSLTTPTNLYIGYAGSLGGLANVANLRGNLYRCKIWKSGVLVRDFVPVQRNSDAEAGLFDKVNQVFYGNSGAGVLIGGPAAEIEGRLVINFTGEIPTKTSDLTNDSGFVESSDLATVATSGSYNDLSDKPTIPDAQVNSDWNANSGVAQILNKPALATVATTGAYSDLSGTPTIPTVNDSTITITQGGVTKGSFTLNQASGDTIALDAGGGSLSSLSDVTLTTPTDGQVLTYDNGDWVNADPTGGYHPDLFSWQWADHQLNDVQWLRADTFSWQDGTVYEAGYDHLTDDISGKTLQSETISGTTVQFYLADDGHKICPASEESNVTAIYTATGVAWYYILDAVNQRFKLPRTKFGVTGLRDTVGKYVEAGLPNITGDIGYSALANQYGTGANDSALYQTIDSTYGGQANNNNRGIVHLDASRSNSIYGNSTTVQPPATQMYLYFYVGSFTQTALENTAGLNAELFNGKADIDLSNTPMATADYVVETQLPTAQNNYTWYRKYKSGWVEQGAYNFMNGYIRGAYFTVTLPITMADANYTVSLNFESKTQNYHSGTDFFLISDNYTTTGFHYLARGGDSNNYQVSSSWVVCGMAA